MFNYLRGFIHVFESFAYPTAVINKHGIIKLGNSRFWHFLNYNKDELINQPISVLLPKDDGPVHMQAIANYLKTGEKQFLGKIRNLRAITKNSTIKRFTLHSAEIKIIQEPMFVLVLNANKAPLAAYGFLNTTIQAIEYAFTTAMISRKNRYTDNLTGIYNRAFYNLEIERLVNKALKHSTSLACALININNFRKVNNFYGTQTGDKLLITVAKIIQQYIIQPGLFIRSGGDEFLIISELENPSPPIAKQNLIPYDKQLQTCLLKDKFTTILNAMYGQLNKSHPINNHNIKISPRIAYLIFQSSTTTNEINASNIQKKLGYALDYAKKNMQGIVKYTPQIELQQQIGSLDMAENIQECFDKDLFFFCLQPIYNAQKIIVGFEVLVRAAYEGQVLQPQAFIHSIYNHGFAAALNQLILQKLLTELSAILRQDYLKKNPGLTFAINIAPQVCDFEKHLQQLISLYTSAREKLTANFNLEFEITEVQFIDNDIQDKLFFRRMATLLKKNNISLAIDDFGIEYSAISRLIECKFNTIKIDIAFTQSMSIKGRKGIIARAFVESLITFAKKMGMKVTAEGVETEEQFALLKCFSRNHFQGFLFSKPLSVEQFKRLAQSALN